MQIAVSQEFEDYLRDTGQVVPAPESVSALIDPGADDTLVSADRIAKLSIPSTDRVLVMGVTGNPSFWPTYHVRLLFPHGSAHTITVVETPFTYRSITGHLIECLIGCDLLARGVFCYDGPNGKFRLTI